MGASDEDESDTLYAFGNRIPGGAFAGPYGLLAPTQAMALQARRYMYENGVDDDTMSEFLGSICVRQRAYANRNPNAMMKDKTLTIEDYKRGRVISTPFRLYDLCLESDGACAFIMTSAERACNLRQRPIYVMAANQTLRPWQGDGFNIYSRYLSQLTSEAAAKRTFVDAGLSCGDIDVALLYEACSFQVLAMLEDFGFCKRGEAGYFYKAGGLPINTHGGHLSEGYVQGLNLIIEAVRQLRDTSMNQVPGAEVAFLSAQWSSAILRR
jgi:acetyl-CoA acetyltransferase